MKPSDADDYRLKTNTIHAKMAGISFHTFLCPICKVSRHVRGRVARGNGKGFRCSVCEEKRQARIAKRDSSAV